jgi:hypothetical protein
LVLKKTNEQTAIVFMPYFRLKNAKSGKQKKLSETTLQKYYSQLNTPYARKAV